MRFIKLTIATPGSTLTGGPCYINLERIASIYRDVDDRFTFICFSEQEDNFLRVRERPEDFLLPDEWRE